MTRFSVVVPTLRRADTLAATLRTLVSQRDLEIVVQNNGNDPATRALVEQYGDRVRHFATDEVLPMTGNWELALANATGDYITFIGDDDGLLPDAYEVAAAVLGGGEHDVLSWAPFLYLWPMYWDAQRRNRLHAVVRFEFSVNRMSCAPLLRRFYRFEEHYSALPMIYNSFVSRALVERVIEAQGAYFIGSSPDVTSGIVNAAFTPSFLKSTRPLSVAGISQHSTGHKLTRSERQAPIEELQRDFPLLETKDLAGSNLEWVIAADMRLVRDSLLDGRVDVTFSEQGLVSAIAAAINQSPSRYEKTKDLIKTLSSALGLAQDEVSIPDPLEHPPAPRPGVHVLGAAEVLFEIDGDALGLSTVADAVALASQLVPRAETLVVDDREPARLPTVSEIPISFSTTGEGATALVSGWGRPEAWGTWSVERECTLQLDVPSPADGSDVLLGIRYRTIPLPAGGRRIVEYEVAGQPLGRWQFGELNYEGEETIVVPHRLLTAGLVELTFTNVDVQSPRELGIGDDSRRLGIGIERLQLL